MGVGVCVICVSYVYAHTSPTQRTFREIMFLQELGGHENIIKYVALLL